MSEKIWTFPCEWIGSKDEIGGVAVFQIDGKRVCLILQKFGDMQEISNSLDVAFQMGRDSAKSVLLAGIENAIRNFKSDFK